MENCLAQTNNNNNNKVKTFKEYTAKSSRLNQPPLGELRNCAAKNEKGKQHSFDNSFALVKTWLSVAEHKIW